MSLDAKRPKPVFSTGRLQFSTKKEKKSVHRSLKKVPKAPPRSCPVTRILLQCPKSSPRLISFNGDASDSFIFESQSYDVKKEESYFEQCFVIEDKLGAGSFGEVYRVRSKDDGKVYACKKTLMKYRGERDRLQRIEEVRKLQQLPRHPNCVEFFHAWEEDLNLFMLTEVCKTSLSEIISKTRLSDSQIWSYIVDILEGLNHLHMNKLIHMDLKPENIFVGMDSLCKIGDFGLVIDFSNGSPNEAMEGDPRYLAPECFNRMFTPSADMFSFGITILELATDLDLPTSGPEWHELRMGKLPDVANGISPDMQCLLLSLLKPNPLERQTASQLLEWPVIKRISTKKRIQLSVHNRVSVFWHYVEPFFLWSYFIVSFISSFLSGFSLFKYKRKDVCVTPKIDDTFATETSYISQNFSRSLGELPDLSSEDEPDSLCLPQPIINSTPISTFNLRRKLPLKMSQSIWHNSSQQERESRCSSKNSDLLVLESSDVENDFSPPQAAHEEGPDSILKTSRNLLLLFNKAQDSDDDEV